MSEQHEGDTATSDGDHDESDQQHGAHDADSVSSGRTHRVWPWVVFLLAIAVIVSGFIIPLPYYVDGPGTVSATQPLVSVSGHPSFTSTGEVMFTTVSERRATPFLLLQSWLDDTIETIPAKVAVPTGNRTAERKVEQQQMDRSKLTALSVAFDRLGLPVTITGSGAMIREVMQGFPGSKLLEPGDVIVELDGKKIMTATEVGPLMVTRKVGDVVSLVLRREGAEEPVAVDVPLGENADDLSRGFLGVVLTTADEDVRLPFEIELDSGSVIGPSAGLAWTLGVLDRLTPGDLTHGKRVAVTGTIDNSGAVGPIGGIAQKIAGAKLAGATLFLYPASTDPKEIRRVREIAGDEVTIKPVATVDEALEVLDPKGLGADQLESPPD